MTRSDKKSDKDSDRSQILRIQIQVRYSDTSAITSDNCCGNVITVWPWMQQAERLQIAICNTFRKSALGLYNEMVERLETRSSDRRWVH